MLVRYLQNVDSMLANTVMSTIVILSKTSYIGHTSKCWTPQTHKVDLWHGHKFSLDCYHKAFENCKSFCKKVGIQVAVNDMFCRLTPSDTLV